MDIKNIYENIHINQLAQYQIKVKGNANSLRKCLRQYSINSITSETTDLRHPICMITVGKINQRQLFALVNLLVRNHYPIISVICSHIDTKADADRPNEDKPPSVMTA